METIKDLRQALKGTSKALKATGWLFGKRVPLRPLHDLTGAGSYKGAQVGCEDPIKYDKREVPALYQKLFGDDTPVLIDIEDDKVVVLVGEDGLMIRVDLPEVKADYKVGDRVNLSPFEHFKNYKTITKRDMWLEPVVVMK